MASDMRLVYGTGGTTLSLINTLLSGDGASVAGMPLKGNAATGTPTLVAWGALNLIADTHREIQLLCADQYDARTGEYDIIGASGVTNFAHYWTKIPFRGGVRSTSIRSNTAAGKPIFYMIDDYGPVYPTAHCGFRNAYQQKVEQTLTAATAQTTVIGTGLAPTPPIKAGKYAILGCKVNALTDHALIRFRHADFNGYAPGIPVTDNTNTLGDAASNQLIQTTPRDPIQLFQGYQFVYMDRYTGMGCPVFTASSAASGLTIEIADATADTAQVQLYLAVVG